LAKSAKKVNKHLSYCLTLPIRLIDDHLPREGKMDIIVGNTPFVKKDPERDYVPAGERKKRPVLLDRRKKKVDRRKSNREGIFVSISIRNDRRKQRDRRAAR
jgi:hypothetical protein